MSIIKAVILGAVQGITEFLPISSSGHLSLFQHFLGVGGEGSLLFSVLLHLGTLIAVFLSCSDEALPILLSAGGTKALMVIPIVISKFAVAFLCGYLIDLFIKQKEIKEHLCHCDGEDIHVHVGCCNHYIDDENEDKFEKHIWHPFIHSLKLFGYIVLINIIFSTVIYLIGEDKIMLFLESNKYIAPIFSTLVGLIPNCASSVILAELFIGGGISLGALLSGLFVNAGLGLVFIFKDKSNIKNNLYIVSTLIGISLITGYITCLIIGF